MFEGIAFQVEGIDRQCPRQEQAADVKCLKEGWHGRNAEGGVQ